MSTPAMTVSEISKQYVSLCKEGQFERCLDVLFAPDAVSIEAGSPTGMSREAIGVEAIRAKGQWWSSNHTIHSSEVFGPFPNEDRFIVRFVMDITQKQSGRRVTMDEAALFTVANGKIVKEEFFYSMGG